MQRLLNSFSFFLLSFTLSIQIVSATGSSGIDWADSTLKVEFSPESTFVPTFSCFAEIDMTDGPCTGYSGPKDHCVWSDLESLGFSDEETNPPIDTCYRQAGAYTSTVQLVDFADNADTPQISNFTIKAGSPDPEMSSLSTATECDDLSLEANGQEVCTLTLTLLDSYENPVTQLKGTAGYIYSDSEFPNDGNRSELGAVGFRDGVMIKMPGESSFDSIPASTSTRSFTIPPTSSDAMSLPLEMIAWTPSMTRVGAYLGNTGPLSFSLQMDIPSIDADGSVDTSDLVTFEYGDYAPSIGFIPWIKILLALEPTPPVFLLNAPTGFIITPNIYSGITAGFSSLIAYLTHHDLPVEFTLEDMDFDPTGVSIPDPAGETEYPRLVLNAESALVAGGIGFSSDISYQVDIDGDTTTELIRYPSGALGSGIPDSAGGDDHDTTPVTLGLLGVSVEGKLLGSKGRGVFQDFNAVPIGPGYSIEDIREEVFENAYRITRGIEPKDLEGVSTFHTFNANWFDSETNIIVIDGHDVTIGSSGTTTILPSGQNTLLIKDGNLIIEGDIAYASTEDSFGFILVNETVTEAPSTGNIFIKNNIKDIAGTFFTEGALMTIPSSLIVSTTGNITTADVTNGASDDNDTQLLLRGTILTHNTLGGGLKRAGELTYFTPWGNTADTSLSSETYAQKYDLHFMRSYIPEYDSDAGTQLNTADCVPGSDAYGCDPNHAAMVIRYDGRVVQFPPPGFTNATFIER